MNIPEAIQHPRGLALGGSWSVLSGSHLTFTASEDILANGPRWVRQQPPAHGEAKMLSKDALRKALRRTRQDARKSVDFWGQCPPSALAAFQTLLKDRPIMGGYRPVGSEADPAPLLEIAAAHGCPTALPFIADRAASMEFRRWKPGDPLEKGVFGFEQPLASAPAVTPDILIVPLLGFDAAMNRLGQGAGHYDRYFSLNTNNLRLGISYISQQIDALPADPWDIPLDAILTEKGWITGPASRIKLP